jgi:hypothetical protein
MSCHLIFKQALHILLSYKGLRHDTYVDSSMLEASSYPCICLVEMLAGADLFQNIREYAVIVSSYERSVFLYRAPFSISAKHC